MTEIVDLDRLELNEARIRADIADALEAAGWTEVGDRKQIADVVVTDMPHRLNEWLVVEEDCIVPSRDPNAIVHHLADVLDPEELRGVLRGVKATLKEWGESPPEEEKPEVAAAPTAVIEAISPVSLEPEAAFTF